jgi:Rieske Fe-S protein
MTGRDSGSGDRHAGGCTGCAIGRRAFLRESAAAATTLAAMGSHLSALPVYLVSAISAHGKEVTYAIPAGDSVNIDRDKEVILARTGSLVFAFDLSCPHQSTALRWLESDKRFQCPKHKSLYSAEGLYIEGRATRSMDRHAIRRDGNNVTVDIDKVFEEDHDAPLWKAAFVKV